MSYLDVSVRFVRDIVHELQHGKSMKRYHFHPVWRRVKLHPPPSKGIGCIRRSAHAIVVPRIMHSGRGHRRSLDLR